MKPLPCRSRMEGDLLTLAVTGSCAGRLARATAAREGGVNAGLRLSCQLFVLQLALRPV